VLSAEGSLSVVCSSNETVLASPVDTSFCIKEAPDVDTPFSVQNGEFALYADRVTLNAYDASAAGAVLRLIEEHGGDIEAWR